VDYHPLVAPPSNEGREAIGNFQIVEGVEAELVAAEPLLANPVAFYLNNQGQLYVAETFRHFAGVTDMRDHTEWLSDDLDNRTIEDRLIAMKRNLGTEFASYTVDHDRIRMLIDTDGDGKFDTASVFADGFKDALAGIGSGVLDDRRNVYYTCIPDLWLLRDEDGDRVAEVRRLLSSGYGVHISLLGHDTHGLIKGPDGRLYFSIGDRGFNIGTPGGKLEHPDTGAVFRCNLDGSDLEVLHTGLRNPQELAFDDRGNLFTGDNNSDSGDLARWVQIIEGANSGWLISYQWAKHPESRGPWNSEKLWHLEHEGQPAYILPPLAHIGAGPSGLTYYPGTGLPDRYQGHFFLCDFRGNFTTSLIHAFEVTPSGASFEMKNRHDFIKGVLPTDADFGPGPGLYLTDWTDGWNTKGKGRVYRLFDPTLEDDPLVVETENLLKEGFSQRSNEELAELLSHRNQRVRFEAQWELADRGEEAHDLFVQTARSSENLHARLHSIWGLWQLGLAGRLQPQPLVYLLADSDPEIRAQAAKVLGDLREPSALNGLLSLTGDDSARVRLHVAIALGRLGSEKALAPLIEMVRSNGDSDVYLRHGAVMGLAGVASDASLAALSNDSSRPVRLAALLALRHHKSPEVAEFLSDEDSFLVKEAARAINDVPIVEAYPDLARLLEVCAPVGSASERALFDRVINAHFRLGGRENAEALARFAARVDVEDAARVEALDRLANWEHPEDFDRVDNIFRPLPDRPAGDAREAVRPTLLPLLSEGSSAVKREAARIAGTYGMEEADGALLAILENREEPEKTRIAALRALAQLGTESFEKGVEIARQSDSRRLRSEMARHLERLGPAKAVEILNDLLERGAVTEKQSAFAALAKMEGPESEALLLDWMTFLLEGKVSAEIQLDLLEAAKVKDSAALKDAEERYRARLDPDNPLAPYESVLYGGDEEAGKEVFFEKVAVSCQRCHKIDGEGGGEAGPDLSHVASKHPREYFLESVLFPNAKIAAGFENVTLVLQDGSQVRGRVVEEDNEKVTLEVTPESDYYEEEWEEEAAIPHSEVDTIAEGGTLEPTQALEKRVIPKSAIKVRRRNLSSMPEGLVHLMTPFELRDVIEYLARRR
jgi:quinoprotein glucose dehydrogenase